MRSFDCFSCFRFQERGALLVLASIAFAVPAQAQIQTAKIAVAVSVTGANNAFGSPAAEGARLAVEEANASGQTPRIELDVADDASIEDRGREIARRIIAGDALVAIGPATTPMALAVGPEYAQGGLDCIGTTTTGDDVTKNATFFRASFSTSDSGEMLANYVHYVLDGKKAIVLFRNDAYGQPVAAGFRRAGDRLGIDTAYHSYMTDAEAEEIAHLAVADPDHPAIILAAIDAVPLDSLAASRSTGASSGHQCSRRRVF